MAKALPDIEMTTALDYSFKGKAKGAIFRWYSLNRIFHGFQRLVSRKGVRKDILMHKKPEKERTLQSNVNETMNVGLSRAICNKFRPSQCLEQPAFKCYSQHKRVSIHNYGCIMIKAAKSIFNRSLVKDRRKLVASLTIAK